MNNPRKVNSRLALLALFAALSSAPVAAAIDLRDYDNDLMRDLDKTIK